MNCEKVKYLMSLYIIGDSSLTVEQREEFESHVRNCPACKQDYQESQFILDLVGEYGTVSDETVELLRKSDDDSYGMTVEEGWEDLKRRIPELAQMDRQQKRQKKIRRLCNFVSIAASIILIFSLSWKFFSSQTSTSKAVPVAANFHPTAELIEGDQRKPLDLGRPIITQNQKQEIQLGKMHQLMMNANTSVTIRTDQFNGKIRYNLELTKGELYVEVVPGNPFTVQTPNAHLIITGTKFNVRYDENQTNLTLVRGSIHFGNTKEEWTDVIAGQNSSVLADASPTTPQTTDASKQIAWTKETTAKASVAKTAAESDGTTQCLESLNYRATRLPSLDSLHYDSWINDNRDYFACEFPWIFDVEKALKKQAIEKDYITLLIVSGDIWQFTYSCSFNKPVPIFNPNNLKRIVEFYQIDPAILNDFVPKTKHEPQNYAKAFKLWLQDIQHAAHEEELPLGLQTFTLHATHYLNNTYTAVYLWIDAHPELAQQLLADQEYIAEYASVLPTDKTVKSWQKDIQEKVSIFQEANLIAQKLNYGAGVSDCSSQPKELMWQLQQEISSLLPKELNAETTTGGDSR